MMISGTPAEIMSQVLTPEAGAALTRARASVPRGRQEILPYQAACLFALTSQYNDPDARILEIGTYYGYSAAIMAQAAPLAQIVTLNPRPWECETARSNLRNFKNVRISEVYSWDYLQDHNGLRYQMVFVDGDHKQVRRDLPWWNALDEGGLFLFHDYSPNGSARACPPVYRALNFFRDWLGRDFDVLIVDDQQIGMAGWYKRESDLVYTGELQNG